MPPISVNMTNHGKVVIKEANKGTVINQWSKFDWLNNPKLLTNIVRHITEAYENPYKYSYYFGEINDFDVEEATFKNRIITDEDYSLHTEVTDNKIIIYDLTCDKDMNESRKQKIKGWDRQEWNTAPFIGELIISSVILSYENPKKYINRIITGKENNFHESVIEL